MMFSTGLRGRRKQQALWENVKSDCLFLSQIFRPCRAADAGWTVQGWSTCRHLVETEARRWLRGGGGETSGLLCWSSSLFSLHLQVDQEGRLTGPDIAYIYPDYLTVLVGHFQHGQMEAGQEHLLAGLQEDHLGVKVPTFQRAETADHLHLHRRQIGRCNYICDGT